MKDFRLSISSLDWFWLLALLSWNEWVYFGLENLFNNQFKIIVLPPLLQQAFPNSEYISSYSVKFYIPYHNRQLSGNLPELLIHPFRVKLVILLYFRTFVC